MRGEKKSGTQRGTTASIQKKSWERGWVGKLKRSQGNSSLRFRQVGSGKKRGRKWEDRIRGRWRCTVGRGHVPEKWDLAKKAGKGCSGNGIHIRDFLSAR